MHAHRLENGLYVDSEGRYWVAIGPNVVNTEHSTERRNTNIDISEIFPGTKIDIVVEYGEEGDNAQRFYIPAVVGDAKEHSYPEGLYQTGIPFNRDRAEGSQKDKNTVEFIGYDIEEKVFEEGEKAKSCVNVTNNYRLIGIRVYDGVYNYE